MTKAKLAKEDALGSLFFMLGGMLLTFCRRVQTINMKLSSTAWIRENFGIK